MAIQKKEYELSIWTEYLDSNGIKKEKKGAIIGAHDMEFLGRATDIKLRREIKGTNTLTFQLPSKFYDSKAGKYVHNDFSDLLKNETKLKLKYSNMWFEFYVKSISEQKQFKAIMYNYTCEDCFIDELSRIGYDIQFDNELNNSVEELGTFTEIILEDSIWKYSPENNIGDFVEYNEQKFYKIPLSQFGGAISAYPIKLSVNNKAFFYEENGKLIPNVFLQKRLDKDQLIWKDMTEKEKSKYLAKLSSILNIFTNEKRTLEYGDDLAREYGLFWDPYYKDNGEELLSSNNLVKIEGKYIYVPITDLSVITGSVYQNSYEAIEEPALYGSYGTDSKKTYALQPYSKNPRDLIQFLFFEDGDELKIDEEGVLINNNYHYVIPIEEWNAILEQQLSNIKNGIIYWTAVTSSETPVNPKYNVCQDEEKGISYTTNVYPYSSTIDDFTWWPVYSDGYLEKINDTEVTEARKISIADRTEYNKNADTLVKVYNNLSSEFNGGNNEESLYSEEEIINLIKDGEEFRVTSKEQTRLIVPTLARNLVENGTEITDTNGWEARTQNRNHEKLAGTGSSVDLLSVETQSTLQRAKDENVNVTIDEYDIDGSIDDETVSDYYLEIKSPGFQNTEDFSLQGTTQVDYVLNFGLISQEKKIEKDKVYALRMRTGNIKQTGAYFTYRSSIQGEHIEDNFEQKAELYKKTILTYKQYLDYFQNNDREKIIALGLNEEYEFFKFLIDNWPKENDTTKNDKLKLVDGILNAILFGGENIKYWDKNNVEADGKDSIAIKNKDKITGIIPTYDKNKTEKYSKFSSIAIKPSINDNNITIYTNSDIRFIKYALYQNLPSTAVKSNSYLTSDGVQLTNGMVRDWCNTYITYDKIFEKKLNSDLDKIIIGQGSVNVDGNYEIEGAQDENGNIKESDNSYITFKDLFTINGIMYVPSGESIDNCKDGLGVTKYIKHVKDENGWHWDNNSDDGILDEPFLLFKANQTIENPYIGIKMESGPLEIVFDTITQNTYSERNDYGYMINSYKDNYYYDNIKIKLVPVSSSNFTKEFLDAIEYDEKTGFFNPNSEEISSGSFEWKDEYLKYNTQAWTGNTSIESPAFCQTFLKSGNQENSIPYILFFDNQAQGIVYLNLESSNGGDSDE